MRRRLTKLAAALAALTALAVGGATLASAGSKANAPVLPPASQSQQEAATAVDGDNIQQGDQAAPDGTDQALEVAAEQKGSESEQPESGPGDGPGGYADASDSADTQQQGEH